MTTNRSPTSRGSILRGLIVAGLFLGAAAALKALSPDHQITGGGRRLLGVLMGIVVVAFANAAPKALSPLIHMRCDPRAEQAIRRFSGWTLVLGGAAYTAAWVIAPLEIANTVSAAFLGAALLLVVARLVWGMAKGSRA